MRFFEFFARPAAEFPLWAKLLLLSFLTFVMYFFATIVGVVMLRLLPYGHVDNVRLMQFATAVIVFGITAVVADRIFSPRGCSLLCFNSEWFHCSRLSAVLSAFLLAAVAILFFSPAVSYLSWLNECFIPKSQGSEQIQQLTDQLLLTDSFGIFLLNVLILAVVPAVVEEMFFRGVVQGLICRHIPNVHIAVWFSAFVFSAFHMQFDALLPRWLLGAFLGYLFLYSGSLWLSSFAHYANNVSVVIIAYFWPELYKSDVDIVIRQYPLALVASLFVIVALLFLLSRCFDQNKCLRKL